MYPKKILTALVMIGLFVLFVSSTFLPAKADATTSPAPSSSSISNISTPIAFTPTTKFQISTENGAINFAQTGSYANATLDGEAWDFEGLTLTGSNSVLPMVNGVAFSVSAQNCAVTITRFDPIIVFPPQWPGHLEYTVSGVGNQTFNVHYGGGDNWLSYNVTIDGEAKTQKNGWVLADGGWLTVTGAKSNVKISYGMRSPTTFTSANRFAIPAFNGSIGFKVDGTYVFTDFNGSMWTFQNLELSKGGSNSYNGYWALEFSAKNSNVNITSFNWDSSSLENYGWVNYTISGIGTQTLNPSYDRIAGWPINYTVYVDGNAEPQGTIWNVTDDGWLTVTGATANVSIMGVENIPLWIKDMPPPGPVSPNHGIPANNTYFYIALSMILVTTIAIPTILLIRGKARKQSNKYLGWC